MKNPENRSLIERYYPEGAVVQGGMGVRVFGPRGAAAVMATPSPEGSLRRGNIATLSETAMGYFICRELQDGDPTGLYRRALELFPNQDMVKSVIGKFFQADGIRPEGQKVSYRGTQPYRIDKHDEIEILSVMGTFCDTLITRWLAEEMGAEGTLGLNGLQKIDRPTAPHIYGGMLAEAVAPGYGIEFTARGAGVPDGIPDLIDALYDWRPTEHRVKVVGQDGATIPFDPRPYNPENLPVSHPELWAIVTERELAKYLATLADVLIVESRMAGGHNGPGPVLFDSDGYPIVGRDFSDLGVPIIHAGGVASWGLGEVRSHEGHAIQIGSALVNTAESEFDPEHKAGNIAAALQGTLHTHADAGLSPTGFPFWLTENPNTAANPEIKAERAKHKVCDLAVLTQAYIKPNGEVGYRCISDTQARVARSFGKLMQFKAEEAYCLCNGLMAGAGKPQIHGGYKEPEVESMGAKGPMDMRIVLGAYPGEEFTTRHVIESVIKGIGAARAKKVAAIDYWNSKKT